MSWNQLVSGYLDIRHKAGTIFQVILNKLLLNHLPQQQVILSNLQKCRLQTVLEWLFSVEMTAQPLEVQPLLNLLVDLVPV